MYSPLSVRDCYYYYIPIQLDIFYQFQWPNWSNFKVTAALARPKWKFILFLSGLVQTMCECYLHILFWLADHNLFGQADPLPLFEHKYRCCPVMCQFSITLHTPHKMTVHSQPLETLLSNLQMTLQSSTYCLPFVILTHTSLRWIDSQNSALTTSLN